ncbi:MAG: DUF2179 domain-containing protein [Sedimentisphaeraceae bacterium JB056]
MTEYPEIYQWIILPFLIFLSRVADVSLGTIRVIFISRGMKYLAPVIGFFEIFVWLLAIGQVMQNLSSPVCYLAYALGFSAGNYIGIRIAEKLSLGKVLVRVVTQRNASELMKAMSESGYGVTTVDGQGAYGPVKIIFTIIPRKKQQHVFQLVQDNNPRAFCTIEEIGNTYDGTFPINQSRFSFNFRPARKSK